MLLRHPVSAASHRSAGRGSHATTLAVAYLAFVLVALITVELMGLHRMRAVGLLNVPLWYFTIAFVATMISRAQGMLVAVALATLGPELYVQLNSLLGSKFVAWSHPGVSACVGFLAGCYLRRDGVALLRAAVERSPRPLIWLQMWILVSSCVAVSRNVLQSGSEFSLHGLRINISILRSLSWHDDYFPLQDAFIASVAMLLVLAVWSVVRDAGSERAREVPYVILFSATVNAAYAIWQKTTGLGWIRDEVSKGVNAFLPDLHSFAALMAASILLAAGLLSLRPAGRPTRFVLVVAIAACAGGLYLSNSRSTLVFVLVTFVGLGSWLAWKSRGWKRLAGVITLAAVVIGLCLALTLGYRNLNHDLQAAFEAPNRAALEVALSHRPEIWEAAVSMYAHFPFFGLGQGEFYRLSAIRGFSSSEFLIAGGGGHPHSYFLQILVELGVVGIALLAIALFPILRNGSRTLRSPAFWGLAGLAMSNLVAHSLLVRELLMVSAVLFALALRDIGQLEPADMRTSSGARALAVGMTLLVLLAAAEAVSGSRRFPFTFAQRCHEAKQWPDGWNSGMALQQVPNEARRIDVLLSWPRMDLHRRPTAIQILVTSGEDRVLARSELLAERPDMRLVPVSFDLREVGQGRKLIVRAPHCYVPLNLGHSHDPRPLGFRVWSVSFSDAAGNRLPAAE